MQASICLNHNTGTFHYFFQKVEFWEILHYIYCRKLNTMKNTFILKGDICWSSASKTLETVDNGFILCNNGKSGGVFREIPGQYADLPLKDHSGKLIIPGLTDLHTHAPQFAFRALGMDMALLEWLNKNTFPEEAKYKDLGYAREAYGHFIDLVKKGPNTRLCVFATIHVPATLLLMDMLEESGLVSLVGKVNMDRNCPEYLREEDSEGATREWLELFKKRHKERPYKNTAPIITPRFVPSCSDSLMKSLAGIQREYGLSVQSHLSENIKEIEWVRELCPKSAHYAGAYADNELLGDKTIMAHCVWSGKKEMDLLAEKETYIAHCPQSNTNLSSGIAPVRRFLEKGIHLGLGSDVAGGVHSSIFRAITDAIQVSKLRQTFYLQSIGSALDDREVSETREKALTLEEAFYLGSAGGGSFFGKLRPEHNPDNSGDSAAGLAAGPAGSFVAGYDFDALVIDDSSLWGPRKLNLRDRLERVVYLSDDRHITGKYVRGIQIL